MTFTDWYRQVLTSYSDTWEQRRYRYIHGFRGSYEFGKAIPEYLALYKDYCKKNGIIENIDIDF